MRIQHPFSLRRSYVLWSLVAAFSALPLALQAADKEHEGHDHGKHDHEQHGHEGHGPAGHREHAVHVHGEGRLTLAISENRIDVALSLPADSAFGFEHPPTSAAETATVDKILGQLKDATAWLGGLSTCKTVESSLANPFALADNGAKDTHRDLEGSWSLDCNSLPAAIDVTLFGVLDRLEHLDVEWVSDKGAGALEMSRDLQRLQLP